eukprot:gene3178-3977_t
MAPDQPARASRLGFIASVVCVIMFASPLEKMKSVLQKRDSEGMLLGVAVLSFLCGISWSIYGLLTGDIYVYLPNILASILSFIQFSLIVLYPPPTLPTTSVIR